MTLRGDAEPARISVKRVSGGFFPTLGVAAALGRVYTDADDPRTSVVVVSDRLWREQFAGDRAAVGRTAGLDGETVTVLGQATTQAARSSPS